MLHRLPSAAALRKRTERARRKAGEVVYRVTVPEYDVAEALRRALVERELAAVLTEWAARWKNVTA